MKINLNFKIQEFMKCCKDEGINIYLVGGAVRDLILKVPTFDYDFALVSDYKEAILKLSKYYVCKTNDAYQSIKFKLDEYNIEITHCREESGTIDNRHPLNINFVNDIKLDSKRRDFTINSLYYKEGKVYDFHGGLPHLNSKQLIVIGDTLTRFKEDSLRMLRMIRFACYGFNVQDIDKNIIFNNASLIRNLSVLAFYSEFDKILLSKNIQIICEYKRVFEMYLSIEIKDVQEISKLDTLNEIKTYLNIQNDSVLYKYRNINLNVKKEELTKQIYLYSKEVINELVKYYDKLNGSKLICMFNDIIENDFCDRKQLAISGQKIGELIGDKKMIGYYIDKISYDIIDKKLMNNEEEIRKYILERER